MVPFTRGPFTELPEKPRRPHGYYELPARRVTLSSKAFGDIEISYREQGSGPPLLLIHGLMTSSYSWRYVFSALAKQHRVIAPDLPGSGDSSKPLGAKYSAPAFATVIRELTAALNIRGCHTVGNSLGGYLCLRAALEDPGVFSKLIDIHSPGVPEPRLTALTTALAIPGLQRALAWWIRREPLRWAHANVHYWDESLKSLEEARAYGTPLSSVEGSRAFAKILADVLAPADMKPFVRELAALRDRGAAFPVPLMFIYARQDPMVPPRVGDELRALIPGARFEWLEDTSHFAHVDSPDRIVPLIEDFFTA